jgi:HNH endonuclease
MKPKKKPSRRKLTAERLRQVLDYCPDTGEFRWLVRLSYRGQAGEIAGAFNGPDGHRRIGIDGCSFSAARLAIFHVTGRYPKYEVRHLNGDPSDLRWENLKPRPKPRPKPPRRRTFLVQAEEVRL